MSGANEWSDRAQPAPTDADASTMQGDVGEQAAP